MFRSMTSPALRVPRCELPRFTRRPVTLLVVLALLLSSSPPGGVAASGSALQGGEEIRPLRVKEPIERELQGDGRHSYEITLSAGQFLHIVVEQRGIDVVVLLIGPDGKKLTEVDSPNEAQGPEPVIHVAEVSGTYLIQVSSLERGAAAGRYEIEVKELRPATQPDRMLLAAQGLVAEAGLLKAQEEEDARRKAVEKYIEALRLWRAVGNSEAEADALHNLGQLSSSLSENQQALEYFTRALAIRRALGDRRMEAFALNNLGSSSYLLGEYDKAAEYYNAALIMWRQVGDKQGEAYSLNGLGAVSKSTDRNSEALEFYREALAIRRSGGNIAAIAYTLHNIGAVYYSLGQNDKALEYYEEALPLMRADHDRIGEGHTLHSIGMAYSEQGRSTGGLEYLNRALQLWRSIAYQTGEANTLYGIARLKSAAGDLVGALPVMETALQIVESSRARISREDLRLSYFSSVRNYYEFYIDLLMRLHSSSMSSGYDAKALQVSERARARGLIELLAEARADIFTGADSLLLERKRVLQQALSRRAERQTRLLTAGSAPEQVASLSKEIVVLKDEYEQVQGELRRTSPRYAALTQPVPASLGEIQQMLDSETTLLEYSLGVERSYLWVVTPTSLESFELPKRPVIEAAARSVYSLLTARTRLDKELPLRPRLAALARSETQLTEAAAALSGIVLRPANSLLRTKRLVIVGDGSLQYIPFGALPAPETRTKSSKRQGSGAQPRGEVTLPLVIAHEIVSLPSASVLPLLRREQVSRRPATKEVAVLADPVFKMSDQRVHGGATERAGEAAHTDAPTLGSRALRPHLALTSAARSARELGLMDLSDLPRLSYTRDLAEAILRLVPPNKGLRAVDFMASKAVATGSDIAQYRTVIFATHGFLDSLHPELSGVVLSLVDQQGNPQDGFLRLNDIFNMKLAAELVILGACETGLGKEVKGEGLVGLTRGFMYAGATRVMPSLWKVSEDATVELIKRLYDKIQKGETAAAALRAAQVEMWRQKRWSSPYYWAGFVLQGDWK